MNWRDALKIHPAAELFPRMSPDELRALGEDIKKNGLTSPITVCMDLPTDRASVQLVEGRNRLDAMELVGIKFKLKWRKPGIWILLAEGLESTRCNEVCSDEALAYIISANIRRRHLSTEDKDRLIVQLLKADP